MKLFIATYLMIEEPIVEVVGVYRSKSDAKRAIESHHGHDDNYEWDDNETVAENDDGLTQYEIHELESKL